MLELTSIEAYTFDSEVGQRRAGAELLLDTDTAPLPRTPRVSYGSALG